MCVWWWWGNDIKEIVKCIPEALRGSGLCNSYAG